MGRSGGRSSGSGGRNNEEIGGAERADREAVGTGGVVGGTGGATEGDIEKREEQQREQMNRPVETSITRADFALFT